MPEVPGMTIDGIWKQFVQKSWLLVTCVVFIFHDTHEEVREVNSARQGQKRGGFVPGSVSTATTKYDFFFK